MPNAKVKPELLLWALKRSGKSLEQLEGRLPKLGSWLKKESSPTFKQLELFSRATFVPIGYLFLERPPLESIPVPDFRTMASRRARDPSANLLDAIYLCQLRQEWYREHQLDQGEDSLSFVGSVSPTQDPVKVAAGMRADLKFDVSDRKNLGTLDKALRRFVELAEGIGVLVMIAGVVGSNTKRKLDPEEFRGFALVDKFAPVVFVNGADTKAAQIFTLAHELVHVWIGRSALSDVDLVERSGLKVERWCNQVAAELLVPSEILLQLFDETTELHAELRRLAHEFKVSTLVILRRLSDVGAIERDVMWRTYQKELARLTPHKTRSGGNFYATLPVKVSKRFARTLIASTIEGETLYNDAYKMLGISKTEAFARLATQLGVL